MSPETVHKLFGAMVAAFAAVLLLHEARVLRGRWPAHLLPIVFHGGSFGAEGLQHQIQGAVVAVAGVVELARVRGALRHRAFGLALPVAILAVAVLFLAHSQHAGGDMAAQLGEHRMLGVTLVVAALVKVADGLQLARGNWARVGWLIVLLAVSLQLFVYAEAPMPSGGGHGGH